MPDSNEVRPRLETEGDTRNTGGRSPQILPPTPVNARFDAMMFDLEDRAAAFIAGYDTGYAAGRSDRRAEAGAVRLATAAAEVVLRCAGLPEVDPQDTARRLAMREARWSQ